MRNLTDIIKSDERLNNNALIDTLEKEVKDDCKTVAVVDRVIRNSDGSVLYEFIGYNATTIGGTQTMVQNTFANLNPTSGIDLITIDGTMPNGPAIPDTWKFDTPVGSIDRTQPRKIIGCMLASDGAVGMTVYAPNRRLYSFDYDNLIPLYKVPLRSLTDVTRFMDMSNTPWTYEFAKTSTAANFGNDLASITNAQRSISNGKYALRATIETGDEKTGTREDYSAYFVKLLTFSFENILLDGTILQSNNDTTTKPSLDCRSKVQTIIDLNNGIMSKSNAQNNLPSSTDVVNGSISSILLVAGRPMQITAPDGSGVINTYGDLIVTNRINFIELSLDNTDLEFRYTIYYV